MIPGVITPSSGENPLTLIDEMLGDIIFVKVTEITRKIVS